MSDFLDDRYLLTRAFDGDTDVYRLDVSTSSASISLPAGGYYLQVLSASGCDHVLVRHSATASIPASGASGDGYVIAAGAIATMRLTATTTVHAITDAGTARLYAIRAT